MDEQQRLEIASAFINELEAKEKHHTMAHQVAEPTLDNAYLIQDTFVDIMLQRGGKGCWLEGCAYQQSDAKVSVASIIR